MIQSTKWHIHHVCAAVRESVGKGRVAGTQAQPLHPHATSGPGPGLSASLQWLPWETSHSSCPLPGPQRLVTTNSCQQGGRHSPGDAQRGVLKARAGPGKGEQQLQGEQHRQRPGCQGLSCPAPTGRHSSATGLSGPHRSRGGSTAGLWPHPCQAALPRLCSFFFPTSSIPYSVLPKVLAFLFTIQGK